jgi:hypothetical protein
MGYDTEAQIVPKVKFTGRILRNSYLKFPHISEAYGVSRIFYTEYGRNRPRGEGPDLEQWVSANSRAYRLLERAHFCGYLVECKRQAGHDSERSFRRVKCCLSSRDSKIYLTD